MHLGGVFFSFFNSVLCQLSPSPSSSARRYCCIAFLCFSFLLAFKGKFWRGCFCLFLASASFRVLTIYGSIIMSLISWPVSHCPLLNYYMLLVSPTTLITSEISLSLPSPSFFFFFLSFSLSVKGYCGSGPGVRCAADRGTYVCVCERVTR